jgi:hypothetical protein
MGSKIVTSFLIILCSIILLFLPISQAVYDFRTDIKENTFTVATAVGTDNATVSLTTAIYGADTSTLSVLSSLTTDVPLFNSYNGTTRATVFTGLTANTTRVLTVYYDVDALRGSAAINNIMGQLQWWWLLAILGLPIAALMAMFYGRD